MKKAGLYFVLIVSILSCVMTSHAFALEGGYVNPFSVSKGDIISLYISTSKNPFDLKIYKFGIIKELIATVSSIPGGVRQVADSSFWYGCNWPVSYEFTVPLTWSSGIYIAEFPTSTTTKGVIFFVRENNLGTHSQIVVSLSTNTWQAYNNYGGKSLYSGNSSGGQRAHRVSFNRPFTDIYGGGQYFNWGNKLALWLERENIPVEFTNNFDLGTNPDILSHYSVLIVAGHDEYWSRPERTQIEKFVRNGGNLIILSGNTCWWQVRYEDEGRVMTCYKDSLLDPLFHVADSLVTVNWSASPVHYPENKITGVSFRNGGYVAYGSVLPKSLGYGDYSVYKSHHWIYKRTGLNDGDSFGGENDIVGYETDGALFNWQNGFPVVTGNDETPMNYQILGLSPAANVNGIVRGHGTMGMYKVAGGGWVFNAATTDWVDGLETDSIVQHITKNVLQRFSSNKFPPEIYSWSPFRVVSDSIHDELVYLNRREFLVFPGDSLVMALFASDPNGESIQYFWTQNDTVVSQGNVFTYRNTASVHDYSQTTIGAHAYNDHDTSSMSWILYHVPLKIVSVPKVIELKNNFYSYKLDVLNYFHDSLDFQILEAPAWLNINNQGIVSGPVPMMTGLFPVVVQVSNQHSHVDSQSFVLQIHDVSTSVQENSELMSFRLSHNFPNPFNPSTVIQYTLPKISNVQMNIYNILGQLVQVMRTNVNQEAGMHSFTWNGTNESGESVSNGIYFYVLTASPADGSAPLSETGKMVLLK